MSTNLTIKQVLKRYPDRTLYIGAGAGYLWIGKGSEASFALKCLSKKHLGIKQRTLEKDTDTLERWERLRPILLDQLGRLANKKKKSRDKQAEIDKLDANIEYLKKKTDKYKDSIENYVPMIERKVRDIYVRHVWQEEDVLGIAVLIEGDEIGAYWNMQEFNEKPKEWLCK